MSFVVWPEVFQRGREAACTLKKPQMNAQWCYDTIWKAVLLDWIYSSSVPAKVDDNTLEISES